MQMKQSYYIATNICSRKSATTFGDLPDWLMAWRRLMMAYMRHSASMS